MAKNKTNDGVERIRSWFCVLNNPSDIDQYKNLTPEEICQKVIDKWVGIKPEKRSAACTYCISSNGLHHLHIVLEDPDKVSFDHIKGMYPKAHIEATRGDKRQAKKYILKEDQYSEKGEEIICIKQHGEIESNQGARTDIARIEQMLQAGMTPREIFRVDFNARKYEKLIKQAYFDKKYDELPLKRDVKVVWHVGESGSGKSYTYVQLCEEHGIDNVYLMTDFNNGGLDKYCGEPILFMDEFRGQIPYSVLLSTFLQGLKGSQPHSRFVNCYSLWNEVHITSVMSPEMVYSTMVQNNKQIDTLKQLLRRITEVHFHWNDDTGYHVNIVPSSNYIDYNDLVNRSLYPNYYNDNYYKTLHSKTNQITTQINSIFPKPSLPNPFKV